MSTMMEDPSLSLLEAEVLNWLLRGDEPVLHSLRRQLLAASILSRELTGRGFHLKFDIRAGDDSIISARDVKPNFYLGDVEAHIETLKGGAGFVLWVTDGKLDMLEGYTYGQDWPAQTTPFELNYIGGERDWDALRKQWLSKDK